MPRSPNWYFLFMFYESICQNDLKRSPVIDITLNMLSLFLPSLCTSQFFMSFMWPLMSNEWSQDKTDCEWEDNE
jgi:hypothetical protein